MGKDDSQYSRGFYDVLRFCWIVLLTPQSQAKQLTKREDDIVDKETRTQDAFVEAQEALQHAQV